MDPRLTALGYAAGWRLVRTLPETAARRAFDTAADRTARRAGAGATQLRRNLARVVPTATPAELDVLVREGLRSYARYWREAFQLPAMDHELLRQRARVTGQHHIRAALAAGRGTILALPHTGNWDMAGVWLLGALHDWGYPAVLTTVAQRQQPEWLQRRFVSYRESLGFEVVPLTVGTAPLLDTLADRLAANRVVCLLADRDLTPFGVPVRLFGEVAGMPSGPAGLAARTGAALLPVGCWFTPHGWAVRVHPPLPPTGVQETIQALADAFAADVATHPPDWHMLQPVWAADLPEPRRTRLLHRAGT